MLGLGDIYHYINFLTEVSKQCEKHNILSAACSKKNSRCLLISKQFEIGHM
jgi:hypothetical protein